MNIQGKTYKRSLDGKTVTVTGVEGDIAILENNTKVNIDTLLNSGEFIETPNVDLFSQNNNGFMNSIFNSVKNIPDNILSNIRDNVDNSLSVRAEGVVENHNAAVADVYNRASNDINDPRQAEELRKKAIELQRKAMEETKRQTELINSSYLEEGEGVNTPEFKEVSIKEQSPQSPQKTISNDNPMSVMFKGFKRVKEFKCKIEISEMIPNYELIKMFEDGYEMSIIDFLTDEILNKVASDPNLLRKEIKKNLEMAVYGKPRKTVVKETPNLLKEFKRSKNKQEYLKSIKNKNQLIELAISLKLNPNKSDKRDLIEKLILGLS
jgi:hypothetical protein